MEQNRQLNKTEIARKHGIVGGEFRGICGDEDWVVVE